MSEEKKEATHNRLMAAFKMLGPYLREEQCVNGCYFFDCLAVCINEKKEPEQREFWGWWMELQLDAEAIKAQYQVGRFDLSPHWVIEEPKNTAIDEIVRTQSVFHERLSDMLKTRFGLEISSVEKSGLLAD